MNNIETPYYSYNTEHLNNRLSQVKALADQNNIHPRYAFKANHNPTALNPILHHGYHLDCVSGFEIKEAISSGFNPSQICFAGVGKTDKEIIYALEQDIAYFNVESIQELQIINQLALKLQVEARVCLRVNPDVSAKTHAHISTGKLGDKFGIEETQLPEAFRVINLASNIRWLGYHFHIGSQILNLDNFRALVLKVRDVAINRTPNYLKLEVLNLGGGLGIDYSSRNGVNPPDFESYFGLISAGVKDLVVRVEVELGRALVAESACLITEVLFVKESGGRRLAILDAGMNDLIRPALYGASHFIEAKGLVGPKSPWDLHGPVCESSDCFGKDVMLPDLKRGDRVAIHAAGAYVESMASSYNCRPLLPSIDESQTTVHHTPMPELLMV